MAIDTFMVFVGVYSSVDDAEADYQAVHDLHTEDGLIDAYDAAVIERKDNGKVKSRKDLKELGEQLDNGQAGLVVVGVSDMGAKIEGALSKAGSVGESELKADTAEIQKDAEADLG